MSHDTDKHAGTAFGKHLRTRMVSGLLVLIPLAITLLLRLPIVRFHGLAGGADASGAGVTEQTSHTAE